MLKVTVFKKIKIRRLSMWKMPFCDMKLSRKLSSEIVVIKNDIGFVLFTIFLAESRTAMCEIDLQFRIVTVVPAIYHSCTDWTLYAILVIFNLFHSRWAVIRPPTSDRCCYLAPTSLAYQPVT